jgi:hypothetical protein
MNVNENKDDGVRLDLADALQIVVNLARSAMADRDEEPEAFSEHDEAIRIVEDFATNHFGDD